MKIIVGLGNPGQEYSGTRHNVGFDVLDLIAKKLNVEFSQKKFDALVYENPDFILVKPQTFMNLSGDSVKKIIDFYKLNSDDVFVICDDLDIKVGQAKIKISNSSGGHKGVQDIIDKLNTSNFYRLKIGIGRPEDKNIPISSYVLQKFDENEKKIIDQVCDKAGDAVTSYIYNGLQYVINKFNKKK